MNYLAGLPILKIAFRQFAFFVAIAFVQLPKRERVGVKNLLLAGDFIRARPGKPTEFFLDVSGRVEAVAGCVRFWRGFSVRR